MPLTAPPVRVVVRLPFQRPENPPNDPPTIEWTQEKADMLWKVIERSRSSDSGGADWKGLAAHLEVPLPYLLYRVNARFQEEIRGLKDIQGTLGPVTSQAAIVKATEESPIGERSAVTSSSKVIAPLGVRARLNSLGGTPQARKALSSSTLTLRTPIKQHVSIRPTTPSSDGGSDSEDDNALKEEEAERTAEEQEALDRKLEELQRMMTNDALGLVARPRGKSNDKGRGALSPRSVGSSYRPDTLSSRSTSQSVSSAGSPHGSIPDIPSPPTGESQSHSPISRHRSPTKSSSPATYSSQSAVGHSHPRRYGPLVDRSSDYSSHDDSGASSFSDLSDASLSASALESALLSNIRGNGSRLSQGTRSRMISGRSSGIPR